jgi:hypothetical protein
VGLLINGGSFSKASAPHLFLEDENISQKSGSMVVILRRFRLQTWRLIFEKYSHLRKKRRGADFFSGGFVWWVVYMGRISHTNLKNRIVISRIATSKNRIPR